MKFVELHVANFKAIDQISMTDLGDVVVIAGANGSGKSTIFDAIRFWKSSIGAYQKGEFQNWLNELGFAANQQKLILAHQNHEEPFSINATIELSEHEVEHLHAHGASILAYYFFKTQAQNQYMAPQILSILNLELIEEFRNVKHQILQQVSIALPEIAALKTGHRLTGTVEVATNGNIDIQAPLPLKLILSVFEDELGVIEHFGPQRNFGRERVESLNLAIEPQVRSQRQTSALYNHANKYNGVKAELASAYVRRLISESAGVKQGVSISLEDSIVELFLQFIPGKTFEGIKPSEDGSITFNVKTPAGLHDIADLSSGEKELIYGYLRLKNSGLKNSIVMIDEPELHLNPRLTDGLPDFYYRHLGKPLNNQLWLVTHSDTILRQSVGYEGFNVFHMKTVGSYDSNEAQLVTVTATSDLNAAVIELVGDLAAFKPGGKLVILEGGGDSEYDKRLIQRLFPNFALKVNLISSESKTKVRALHSILDRLDEEGDLFSGVYSIVDSDVILPSIDAKQDTNSLQWDRYHIENYLLEPNFIKKVLVDNDIILDSVSLETIETWLTQAAATTQDSLIRHEMESLIKKRMFATLKINGPRDQLFSTADAEIIIDRSIEDLMIVRKTTLDTANIESELTKIKAHLSISLANGDWIKYFKGRDILKAFIKSRGGSRITYDAFKNQIAARMRDAQFQPKGMADVLSIIESPLL